MESPGGLDWSVYQTHCDTVYLVFICKGEIRQHPSWPSATSTYSGARSVQLTPDKEKLCRECDTDSSGPLSIPPIPQPKWFIFFFFFLSSQGEEVAHHPYLACFVPQSSTGKLFPGSLPGLRWKLEINTPTGAGLSQNSPYRSMSSVVNEELNHYNITQIKVG